MSNWKSKLENWKSKLENWRPKMNNKIRFWLPFYERKMNAQQQQPILFQSAIMHRLLPSTDCPLRARILKWLATFGVEFISSWDRRKWNPFTAISLNYRTMRVNVTNSHDLFSCNYLILSLTKRFPEMDWIRRRQISARPFLRSEKYFVFHSKHSDSVRFGASERGKCHEFDIGEIHGTATGNLFFLFRGSGAYVFIFIFSCWFLFLSFFEREYNRVELCCRV